MESRSESSFNKAAAYLNYNPRAKWAAHLAGFATAVLTVALLVVLWLFIDLMVLRGRIPDFHELTPRQQEHFARLWNALPAEERLARAKAAEVPARRTEQVATLDFHELRAGDMERLWTDEVRRILRDNVGEDAEARVFRLASSGEVALHRANQGILSLVVRERANPPEWYMPQERLRASAVIWLARWNHWMWNAPPEAPTVLPTYLTGLFLIATALVLAGLILVLVQREMAARAVIEATTRLRRAVYHHTFRLGTLAIRALGPSEAVSILTRHIEALHDALYARLTVSYRAPLTLAALVLFAFFIHPLLALAFLLFAVVVWQVGVRLLAYFRRQSKKANDLAAERLTIIRESLMMMRLVKSYLMDQFNQSRIERQLSGYARVQRVRHRADAFAFPLLSFLGILAGLLLLFVGAGLVLKGQLSVAEVVVLAVTLLLLYRPLNRWIEARRLIKRGEQAADQVFRFLERKGEVGQMVGAEFLQPLSRQVEFDNVSLRDGSTGRLLLEEVSLTIPAGHRIGLVGADDLEKHALVYLIPRLLDPTAGEIRIDGHNIRWVTLDSLRLQIGLVMMHNLVFHDSVANNIGCGDSSYTLPQIIEAAKLAHAHHFIQKLPNGYETPLGELGHSLSVSQQFRIALARAILRNPALLIIEEPETPLDEESKDLLDDTLARILPGRTVIFLPHRISTLRNCNSIHLLHKGRVVASGTHKELLASNPLYRHLHYLEFNAMDEQV